MKNEAVDGFLKDLEKETESDPFNPNNDKDVFSEKEKPENNESEEKVEEEKALPFHKDPKIQRFIQKEIEKITKDLKPTATIEEKKEALDEADEILSRIIGNDTPEKVNAVKDLKKYLNGLEERGAQKALTKLQKQQQEEQEASDKARNALIEGLESIEETYKVDLSSNNLNAKKLRSEFIEFVNKIAPKDENGEAKELPDLGEAFATFQELKKTPTNTRAKELANRSMSRSSDASAATKPEDNSWKAAERALSKMNG